MWANILTTIGKQTWEEEKRKTEYWLFLYYKRIIRLDELGQTFVVRLAMRL